MPNFNLLAQFGKKIWVEQIRKNKKNLPKTTFRGGGKGGKSRNTKSTHLWFYQVYILKFQNLRLI